MGRSSIRSSSVAVIVALLVAGPGVVMPSPASAAWLWTASIEAPDFDGLMAKAEEQRGAGEHAAAARSYAAAYRALTAEDDRVGPMGELVIDNALVDYGAAQGRAPEDLSLLEEPVALLERFIETRSRAHEAGRAEAVPPRLVEELARLKAQLEEARAQGEEAGGASEEPGEPGEPVESVESEEPEALAGPEKPGGNRKADVAILASGVVSLVGGVALIGGGAWNFGKIDRQEQARSTALEAGDYTDEVREAYRTDLDAWVDQWRGASTGLVVAGSVLAAAGIGLTTWGAVRMRRSGSGSRRRASLGVPIVSRDRVGMAVIVGF